MPILGDEELMAIKGVLDSGMLAHGPKVVEFEEKFAAYTAAPHCVALSSCTAALHLAYFIIGLGAGDEVIVPAQTHVATGHAVELTGAKAVFVDAEAQTGNIDIDQIESKITANTKALSVVHYLGTPVDMDRIVALAKKHDLFVVEDCALAIGTYYKGKHAGLVGDLGCFSFYPVKHFTTAEGGAVLTNSQEIAKKITQSRAFGMDKSYRERSVPGLYDVQGLGFNYRMNEVESAIGIVQLDRIDGFLKKRKENYRTLTNSLRELEEISHLEVYDGSSQSSYYSKTILLSEKIAGKRPEIIAYLNEHGVGTSIYYPHPVPSMTYYREKYGYKDGDFPVAQRLSDHSIALSVGPHLVPDDMLYVADQVKNALSSLAI